ncbi:hypothetical protein AB4Z48_23590 [Cupriavidus sp. 2TAF22]|uniref:hypothetical protein n=1 Tax=unclassified Cupriavidus TaxID=2640874 RepID=UPI003F8DB182
MAFVSVPRRPSRTQSARAASARTEATRTGRGAARPAQPVSGIDNAAANAADTACAWIRLRLAVASGQVFALRQSLHAAIGKLARIYVVEVDHRHGETTVHVEVERGGRDAAMHAIMMALPAAEFGVTTVLGQDHAAH